MIPIFLDIARNGLFAKNEKEIAKQEISKYDIRKGIGIMKFEEHKKIRDSEEYSNKEVEFLFDLQVFAKFFSIFCKKLYSDYIHILVEHISAFLYSYNDLAKFANEGVENNHSTAKRIALNSTNLGSRGRENKDLFPNFSTPASRRSESVLEIYCAKNILNLFTIVSQIKNYNVNEVINKLNLGKETIKCHIKVNRSFKEKAIKVYDKIKILFSTINLEQHLEK